MMSSSGTDGNLGDAEAAALIAGEDLLSRDDIPDENQQIKCFSCGNEMKGLYCDSCGQKNDDYRRSIWSLFSETFASVFSLENRMWRTWLKLLLKPGQVSREFADGKRTLWTSPVRMYLALSIILFGYMSLTETRIISITTNIVPKSGFSGDIAKLDDSMVKLEPSFGFFRRQAELDRLIAETDFNRIERLMEGRPRQVFVFNDDISQLKELPSDDLLKSSESWPVGKSQNNTELTLDDLRAEALNNYAEKVEEAVSQYNVFLSTTKNPETIGDRLVKSEEENSPLDITQELRFENIEGIGDIADEALKLLDTNLATLGFTRSDIHKLPIEIENGLTLGVGQATLVGVELSETDIRDLGVKVLRNPAILNEGISRYLPRIMFLMMPFAAIIGLIFIRGRKTALLYDHLVHATYIHAVTFAFLLLLILISQWTSLSGMDTLFLFGVVVYLPLSAKRMFKRSWFKTFFASYSIAFFYGLTMFIVLTLLTAQSLVDATDLRQI